MFIQSGSFVSVSALSFTTEPPAKSVAGASFSVGVTDLVGGAINPSATVTLTISSGTLYAAGGGTATPPRTITATTNSSGIATFSGLSIDATGTYTITATVPATDVDGRHGDLELVRPSWPRTAATLSFTTEPPSGPLTAGSNDVGTVVVTAVDTYGNDVAGQSVSLTISSPGAINSGTTSATTQSSGTASFSGLTVETAGTFTFTASAVTSSGTVTATSNSFTIVPAPLATLSFTTQPADTKAGSTMSPVVVKATDQYGNAVFGEAVTSAFRRAH